ncbi:hypothetical protein [Pacificibacter marinus]|uniref:Uncharacterized protein n=1 Tax=Pacificibacter marinus TaxID=658057 RepID=A0A1Y5T1X6_9RHOB|nr:hypothetical protein [Pacificibacter marinus]SEK98514.1 hypothetical protein SAMN04488032_10978 [Pacificibacter marinus]SLN54127.1 hypothetical protein PAM7971_02769 [Pacificibacter marinus]
MAFYSDNSFTSFQGRALGRHGMLSLPHRLRLPVVTLALGALASLVIAAGALDWLPVGGSLTHELSQIEYLTGTVEQIKR